MVLAWGSSKRAWVSSTCWRFVCRRRPATQQPNIVKRIIAPWEVRTCCLPHNCIPPPHPAITMSDLDDEILELAGAVEKKRKRSHGSKPNKRRKEE
jgi:hypothetical protein